MHRGFAAASLFARTARMIARSTLRCTGAAGQPPAARRKPAAIGNPARITGRPGRRPVLHPARNSPRDAAGTEQAESTPAKSAFPSDPELKRAWALLSGPEVIPDDFELAETLVKKVLAKNEADPEAMIVMAYIQNAYIYRGFDSSTAPWRVRHASECCER